MRLCGLRFPYKFMDTEPCLSLRHICVPVLKLWLSPVVQVPLREMESQEHLDGEGMGTRTCHMSTAIWKTDWELVMRSG